MGMQRRVGLDFGQYPFPKRPDFRRSMLMFRINQPEAAVRADEIEWLYQMTAFDFAPPEGRRQHRHSLSGHRGHTFDHLRIDVNRLTIEIIPHFNASLG